MGFRVNLFQDEPDRDIICCICMGVYENPVKDACGHLFCSSCIAPWVRKTGVCPITNQPISEPNTDYRLASRINCLKIKCVECKENFIEIRQSENGCNRCQARRYSNRADAANSYSYRNNSRSIPTQQTQQTQESSWSEGLIKWGAIAATVATVAMAASSASKSNSKRK